MLGRVVTHWEDIIGKDMALKTQPARLSYRQKKGKKAEFTLEVCANSAESTLLRYRVDLILERINRIFGENIITAIRFIPQTANTSGLDSLTAARGQRQKILTPEQKNGLSHMLTEIDDTEIREKLVKLGEAILQDDRS